MNELLDPDDTTAFRRVMGRFPTGLTVVSTELNGKLYGLTCQTFVSVSLEPPLIGMFLTAGSGTLWAIRRSRKFCVSILSEDQLGTARVFAISGADKFRDVDVETTPNGSPALIGSVAWIECELQCEYEAGDHVSLLGLVTTMRSGEDTPPLLYFRGGYGVFRP